MNKGQTKTYVSTMIHTLGVCDNIQTTNPEFYTFLYALLQKHPNPSRMDDVVNIGIKRNAMYRNLELFIEKKSGDIEDISWNKCLGLKRDKLTSAMRYEIREQITEFKFSTPQICVQCGCLSPLHVDHIYPFSRLVKEFHSSHPTPTLFTDGIGNQVSFTEQDKPFADEWSSYHREKAKFQMLCASCNGRKSCLVVEQ